MDIQDATNIAGISKLVNYDGDRKLEDIEKEIIDEIDEIDEVTDADVYKKQLEELGNSLGVNLDDDIQDDESTYEEEQVPYNQYETPKRYNTEDVNTMFNNTAEYRPRPNTYGERITEEQKKQKILNHVLDGIEDKKFSVEKEKEEDDKVILLEQIDMLMINLKDEGIDVNRVPVVDNSSSIEDIENVHKILRLKNDRNRYCSFAEECILAGSHTLEWLFDGEKSYMGRKPDLRGWSATVNIKLRRMRYDTSTFVSGVMQDYNMGHGTRIMFELIPSLFLYSKMKKSQYADNLITSDEMNSAIDRIRDIEENS